MAIYFRQALGRFPAHKQQKGKTKMAQPQKLTRDEILAQLQKEGVNDLNGLADLIVRKAHQDGDPNKPVVNGVIIYNHGFVSS